jgi:2'-5' RNA ligase
MTEQLSLFGPDGPCINRLFLGIYPAADEAAWTERVAHDLSSTHGLRGRPFKTNHFHSSLCHLGDYPGMPDDVVEAVTSAASEVRMPVFDVVFDRAMSFLRRKRPLPFVLLGDDGVVGLRALHASVSVAMRRGGFKVRPDFTPHVTLLYDHRPVAEEAVETVKWTVRDFVLVHSLLGETRHIRLASFPLLG